MSRNEHFKKDAVVYDLHGTLMDSTESTKNAPEIKKNVKRLKKDEKKGKDVVVLSGDSNKDEAEKWLDKNDIDVDKVVTRPNGDTRSDQKVKADLLKKEIKPEYDVKKAYDDKGKNVKMFKKHGIKAKKV